MADLRENLVKKKLLSGDSSIVLMGLDSADEIDQYGPGSHDGIWLEGEHGGISFDEITNLARACDIWGKTSITRVHQNQAGVIYRTLDRGSQGICVPHINTAEEATNVVKAGKFPPIGERGMFPSRQSYGVQDYFLKANDETLFIILIEDIVAINNLDQILSVDHIDVFFVAPSDLAASMGYIGRNTDKTVLDTIDGALAKIVKSGKIAGTLITDNNIGHYREIGVRLFAAPVQKWISDGIENLVKKSK